MKIQDNISVGAWQTLIKEKEFNDLLLEWNKKINLVSRKKTEVTGLIEDSKLFFHAIDFKEGINILDLGTGGGFPGIIIAIHHPEVNLTLIDSVQKKINVVKDVVKKLELKNVEVICSRAEELAQKNLSFIKGEYPKAEEFEPELNFPLTGGDSGREQQYAHKFHYVVSRSVAVLQDLAKWSKDLLKPGGKLVAVKGGNIEGELQKTKKLEYVKNVEIFDKNDRKIIVVRF
ncbi:MAG TPA: RsmG family class I SAM-dependent methyltransferase [Ignavibacteria bacterium]